MPGERRGPGSNELVKSYFHGASRRWDTFYDDKRSPLMRWVDRRFRSDVFERWRLTFETLGDLAGKTVLDVGCGSGPYSVEAARRGCRRVLGIDLAPGMIELAAERAKYFNVQEVCEFRVGNFPQDIPEGRFDFAIVMGVMDYVSEPVRLLQGLRRCVTATVMASVPTPHWFRTPLRRTRYWFKNCPIYFHTRRQVENIFSLAGFRTVKIHKMPGAGMDFFVTAQ
jgi:2-polyprenyl-3-methyl-5-hydroxy-6-metoxy-1,4-benzoquinol methylase